MRSAEERLEPRNPCHILNEKHFLVTERCNLYTLTIYAINVLLHVVGCELPSLFSMLLILTYYERLHVSTEILIVQNESVLCIQKGFSLYTLTVL